jgi:hypothetical protein
MRHRYFHRLAVAVIAVTVLANCAHFLTRDVKTDVAAVSKAPVNFNADVGENSGRLLEEGRKIFRYDSFGSEAFWGDQLQLQKAILGEKQGGVGPGLTPRQALKLGLKADVTKLPRILAGAIRESAASLDNPETTLALLQADAVVGVKGVFDKKKNLKSIGITCALCHSTVDDSFADGIGKRLDGWPNRDLNVGEIVALAPNFRALEDYTGATEADIKKVLKSWGPGRYDAEFNMDGKGFRPDGKSASTLLPAAFGLAGVHLHTYTGWGSVTYWNAYVAVTQMYGQGTFYDPRLNDPRKYPLAVKNKRYDIRHNPDLVTSKLAALHYYQLSMPAPTPPKDSYDEKAAMAGENLFVGKAQCAVCHVPPLFTEPGWAMHTGEEIGIDNFQANRSPDGRYRTTPLKGLFTRAKGGFYHDGRFKDLPAVVEHYNQVKNLALTDEEKKDLVEYLKSL